MSEIALYAYHLSIEWCVLTNYLTTQIINSHWLRQNSWFSLPTIAPSNLLDHPELFNALTPGGLQGNGIEVYARSVMEPDDYLIPVDDALVDSLDRWRDEALRHSSDEDGIDDAIQLMFSQLFVLRAIEDRGLAADIPPLEDALMEDDGVDKTVLRQIYGQARHTVQSELFRISLPRSIPDFVVAGVIRDLYEPHHIPLKGLRYNFSWIGADVLGRAYEKYLSTVLAASRVRDRQLHLWDQPKRDVERISRRKAGGVYYTPSFAVRFIVDKALDAYFEEVSPTSNRLPRIADISCGSGSFLTTAVDSLIRRMKNRGTDQNWGRQLVESKSLLGIDIDKRAVVLARLALWLRLAEEPAPLPLPELKEVIKPGDSLDPAIWRRTPQRYDLVLGNPPFLPIERIPSQRQLALRFVTATGRFDYAYLFVEQGLNILAESGVLGLVIPNRLFKNRDAEPARQLLISQSNLLAVVDFGSTEVFAGISTYVGILLAKKRGPLTSPAQRVRIIEVEELPPKFAGASLYSATLVPGPHRSRYLRAFDSNHPVESVPWMFLSDDDIEIRLRLEDSGEPLSTIAEVFQGIKTGANAVFIVKSYEGGDAASIRVVNGLSLVHEIERAGLRPVTFGSDVQRYEQVQTSNYIVYPYSNGRLLPEMELKRSYPRLYSYLLTYRNLLSSRTSILSEHRQWYELVRERNESLMSRRKLLIRDLASEPSFAMDDIGNVFLVGGTAIVPQDSGICEALMAYLNSSVVGWYLDAVAPAFRSDFRKFEPRHIHTIPVPRFITDDSACQHELGALARHVMLAMKRGDEEVRRSHELQIDRMLTSRLGFQVP